MGADTDEGHRTITCFANKHKGKFKIIFLSHGFPGTIYIPVVAPTGEGQQTIKTVSEQSFSSVTQEFPSELQEMFSNVGELGVEEVRLQVCPFAGGAFGKKATQALANLSGAKVVANNQTVGLQQFDWAPWGWTVCESGVKMVTGSSSLWVEAVPEKKEKPK